MKWFGRKNETRGESGLGPGIESYVRFYQDRLDRPAELALENLQTHHCLLETSLHRKAREPEPNLAAFIYTAQRLPDCMDQTSRVIVGPNEAAFIQAGYLEFRQWPRVSARARRRRAHFDGEGDLALFAASISDLDDIIPSLCAYQIEWNKMHHRLVRSDLGKALARGEVAPQDVADSLRRILEIGPADWEMLVESLGSRLEALLAAVAGAPKKLTIHRLPLRHRDFGETVDIWWREVMAGSSIDDITGRPVYLVSSNTHGLANIVSGFASRYQRDIIRFILENDIEGFSRIWRRSRWAPEIDRRNLVYYAQRLFLERYPELEPEKIDMEEAAGLGRVYPVYAPPIEAQILELKRLDPRRLDPRLTVRDWKSLRNSRALVVNLDYPLGYSAYHLMNWACRRFEDLRGLMIVGKSAAMIGRLGDIMIPGQVRDVHTGNTYDFANCITVRRLAPFLREIAAFDDQKSLTVRGTFLHSWGAVKGFYREDFTGIEMEAGPYLSAVYEYLTQKPGSSDSKVSMVADPAFKLGIVHYTSDTPYNIRAALLSRRLGISGLEASYAGTLATTQFILDQEAR